jgi:D-methionine transport system permease protein
MVAAATLFAYALGLPLGILLVVSAPGHIRSRPWVERVIGSTVNILRSVPFIILLVALIPVTRRLVGTSIGTTAAIVPLVFAAAPFVARMVETALKGVSMGTVEAALAMGATPWQVIVKVLLPEAKPALISGFAITCINVIGYTAMAGAVGGGGLGDLAIQYGYNRWRVDVMIVTVILLVAVVQIIQAAGNYLTRRASHANAI